MKYLHGGFNRLVSHLVNYSGELEDLALMGDFEELHVMMCARPYDWVLNVNSTGILDCRHFGFDVFDLKCRLVFVVTYLL